MKKVKFQFEMLQSNADRLEELAILAGVTEKEIINNALTVFEWAIKEVQAGRVIGSVDETNNVRKELVLPLFSSLPRHEG